MKKLFLYYLIIATSIISPLLAAEKHKCDLSESYCKNTLIVGAEWLYWKAEQSQMEIASNVTSTNSGTLVNASSIIPKFKYSNGYRLCADCLINDCWTIGTSFVHLPSQSSASASNDPALLATNFIPFNVNLYPIFTAFSQSGIFLSNFDVHWSLNLYYLDTYIRRTLCFCNCITLEPYLGARVMRMKQDINMSGNSPNAAGGPASLTASFSEKFYGAGLLAGINACWQLGCGFSFVAKFGSSLIYSSIHNDFNIQAEQNGPLQIINKNKHHKAHPSIDSFIGIQYLRAFCKIAAEVHVGWENHLFFHTNQFSLTTNGNLSLQGLTLGGSLIF